MKQIGLLVNMQRRLEGRHLHMTGNIDFTCLSSLAEINLQYMFKILSSGLRHSVAWQVVVKVSEVLAASIRRWKRGCL